MWLRQGSGRDVAKAATSIPAPYEAGNFLTDAAKMSFSRSILFRAVGYGGCREASV
jgi:hypothetical protein